MSDSTTSQHPRPSSLSIAGFRGLEQLAIPKLGRVTLLAGRHSAGKTTVLDAVRIYAARGQPEALQELLVLKDEIETGHDEDGNFVDAPHFDALFHGRGERAQTISIGPTNGTAQLKIEPSSLEDLPGNQKSLLEDMFSADLDIQCLKVTFENTERFFPMVLEPEDLPKAYIRNRMKRLAAEDRTIPQIRCETLGPGLPSNRDLARLWDKVALTDDESFALDALRLVLGNRVKRTAVVGHQNPYRAGGRVVVKLSDQNRPVPLKSLGDGAMRMFGFALALANCRDGILLLDEAENGIHHTLQAGFWSMVLRTASAHNTQVLATTHSKDCINGFARAVLKRPDIDGSLIRLERENEEVRAVEYSKEELETAAEQDIEVR